KSVLGSLQPSVRDFLTGTVFFPTALEVPFISGMQEVLIIAAVLAFIAAIASIMRGPRYIYGDGER
ncbi:MAG: MFS transporter, partial [Candidatus Marsarchaeota archaeon]|nr:MFS transporter [Candidatus Marsarchaeota archaeon]